MKGFIYIPFETMEREFWHKLILSKMLLEQGWSLFIFEDYVFDEIGYPAKGIYLGKNIFRTVTDKSLQARKAAYMQGVNLFYLDEEFLKYGKTKDEVVKDWCRRINLEAFYPGDKLFVPGRLAQKQIKKEKKNLNCKVIGIPSLLLRNRESKNLVKKYSKVKKQNFILISSTFKGIGLAETPLQYFKKLKDNDSKYDIERVLESLSNGVAFIQLIKMIVDKHPKHHFVFRPHPMESEEFYKLYFSKNANVIVTKKRPIQEWLCKTKLLIQSQSTSGLQAKAFGVPVISVVFKRKDTYPWKLLDVGHKIRSYKEFDKAFILATKNKNKIKIDENLIAPKNFLREIRSSFEKLETNYNNEKIKLNIPKIYKRKVKNLIKNKILNSKNLFNLNLFQEFIETLKNIFSNKLNTKYILPNAYLLKLNKKVQKL